MTTPQQNQNQKPGTKTVAKLNDAALCRRCDFLGNLTWTCRSRGWNRKLHATLADLQLALQELDHRINSPQA